MMAIFRAPENPIIEPEDVKPSRPDFEVVCAFNAGVARVDDEVVLLLRVAERPINEDLDVYLVPIYDPDRDELVTRAIERNDPDNDFSDSRTIATPERTYLTSISHLRAARSRDGINFTIEEEPALFPANRYETFGIEDPRITYLEGTYYINYSAVSEVGITTYLASTKDFKTYTRHGVIFCPDNKDVTIFPEKVNGKYYALHRPTSDFGRSEMWVAESPDLLCWGDHRYLMGTRKGQWDSLRIGGSAVPFRVEEGWLEVYHGADQNNRYYLGAVLLDAEKPWKVLARSEEPIMQPETDYELKGFFGNVIFTCGALFEEEKVKVYYGAADTYLAYAEIPLADVMASLK